MHQIAMAEPDLGTNQSDSSSSSSSDDDVEERGRRRHRNTKRLYESIRLHRVPAGESLKVHDMSSPQHEPLQKNEPIDAGVQNGVGIRHTMVKDRPLTIQPLGGEEEDDDDGDGNGDGVGGGEGGDGGGRGVGGGEDDADDDDFSFFLPGEGPEIKHKETKERAKRAILDVYNELTKEEEKKPTCFDRLCCKCARNEDETNLSPLLQKASSQGINMIKMVFFPSMPALLQDLWVYLELLVSMFAFIFGLVTFSSGTGTQRIFNIVYLVLAIIGMIFSLIDGFIYIFNVGTIAKFIRKYLKSRQQRQHQKGDIDHAGEEGENYQKSDIEQVGEGEENYERQRTRCKRFPQLPEKWLTRFKQFFEVGRNILSELLLYPLLICDLFDFVALGGSQPENAEGRTNFGLFCIGSFYLVLAVYIMRIVTVAGTMVSMLRLPLQATGGQKQYIQLMARFCFYALRQIFVHLLIVLAVAAKIRNENPQALQDEDPINISPFLWSTIFLGWFIPLAGVLVFFVVNYYWTKEFSISFWVDMISLLQGQSFAETVFGGEGISATKETAQHVAEDIKDKKMSPEAKQKTLDFVEKSRLKEVKMHLKRFKSPSVLVKYFHPLKLPLLSLSGLLYDACLIAFVVSLMLTRDSVNGVRVALSDDNFLLATFVLVVIFILLANFHLLILANLGLLVILFFSSLAAICMVISIPILVFVYIPIAGIIGCYQCFFKILRASGATTNQEEIKYEKEGTQPYHKDTDVNGVLPKCKDQELMIIEKELTQTHHKDVNGALPKHKDLTIEKEPTQPHQEETDDFVTVEFVDNYGTQPHHNGALLKHKDQELMIAQKQLTQPHQEETDDFVTIEFVGV